MTSSPPSSTPHSDSFQVSVSSHSPTSSSANSQDKADTKASRLLSKKLPLIDTERVSLEISAPAPNTAPQRLDLQMQRILSRLPADVAASFTERQLQALHQAMAQPSSHAVEWRKSLPIFRGRYYLIFLAGPECRSPDRLKPPRQSWSSASTALTTLLLLMLGLAAYQLLYRRTLEVPAPRAVVESVREAYPAALPWIKRAVDCKGEQREWKNGMCYDSEHSPNF